MQQATNALNNLWSNLVAFLPALLMGIILLLAAWVIATLVRNGVQKGLKATNLDQKLQDWGVAQDSTQAVNTIDSLGQVFYYLVWVLFLPGIFNAFGLRSVALPIQNMIDTALMFLPNVIAAIVLGVIAVLVGRFVYNLVYNLAVSLNIDRFLSKYTGSGATPSIDKEKKDSIAKVLGTLAYIVVFIPILTIALETLGIESIARPIVGVLNSFLSAIPNIVVAVILLGLGIFVAQFVGGLIGDLLEGAGVNNLSRYLDKSKVNFNVAEIIGNIITAIIALFFAVEALNVLNLEVLNTIGAAVILYLPNIIFAIVILALGIIGGQLLGNFIAEATGSKWFGEVLKASLAVLSIFMALEQLNFATSIVNTAFMFIIGGAAVAFALAFGLGGKDFAKRQLDKLDTKIEEESTKASSAPNTSGKDFAKRQFDKLDSKNEKGKSKTPKSSGSTTISSSADGDPTVTSSSKSTPKNSKNKSKEGSYVEDDDAPINPTSYN